MPESAVKAVNIVISVPNLSFNHRSDRLNAFEFTYQPLQYLLSPQRSGCSPRVAALRSSLLNREERLRNDRRGV